MAAGGSRSLHARAILGKSYSQIESTNVLLVGAGGIGCELLKNVVLTGFKRITLLDLDTIDLSNLNRQFLFRKKDVKQSKSLVAAKTAAQFNPDVQITPLHANIKEPQFDVTWFGQFDLVLNALDNLDARRHVNKMCIAANVPLVESGTAGYFGQVQPLLKDQTECFDCIPKPTPKSFPVCTIRSTPSQPIHCIVWAKSYLMPKLFGQDEDEGELDQAEQQGENAEEIANLRKQAQAFRAVREALRSQSHDLSQAAKAAFQKVYDADIRNLLVMKDMWRSRAPPVPLEYDAIAAGTFVLRGETVQAPVTNGAGPSNGKSANGHAAPALRDQKALSLADNLNLFVSSAVKLAAQLRAGQENITFDKDDDDTLDFVTAASNLRSAAYGIPGKTRWEVKEIAGNIIPAIATTNAVIAGLIVLQALHVLRDRSSTAALRNIFLQSKASVPLGASRVVPPNPGCSVCRDLYITVRCDPARATLGEVVRGILDGTQRDVLVMEDKRILADYDWEDNLERTLEDLGCGFGKFITIQDDEEELATIAVATAPLPADHPADGPAVLFPSPMPRPGPKSKPKPVPPASPTPPLILPATPLKKRRREDDDANGEPSAKKVRTDSANGHGRSPTKAQRLEADGLIIVDDDIIILD